MKNLISIILTLVVQLSTVASQELTIPVNMKISPQGTVLIENIFGSVRVRGSDVKEVVVTGEIFFEGKSQGDLERAKKEFSVGHLIRNDTIFIFNKAPFISSRAFRKHYWTHHEDPGYHFKVDLIVEVPKRSNLWVGTIEKGKVEVINISGSVEANNVNGPVLLDGVDKVVAARSINGIIDIGFTDMPKSNGVFNTVNGDITIKAGGGLSSTIEFESMNGDLYSEFDYEGLSPSMVKTEEKRGASVRYQIESKTKIVIGEGAIALSFQSINGNMYIRKK